MTTPIKLITKEQQNTDEVKTQVSEILNEALGQDFEEVFVIGRKGNNLTWRHSRIKDTIQVAGLLAQAQHAVLKD